MMPKLCVLMKIQLQYIMDQDMIHASVLTQGALVIFSKKD